MLRLKAFSWHGATTAQLLVCSSHSLDKQYILQMADGGSCVGKSFALKHPTKRRVGSLDLCTQSKEKNEL